MQRFGRWRWVVALLLALCMPASAWAQDDDAAGGESAEATPAGEKSDEGDEEAEQDAALAQSLGMVVETDRAWQVNASTSMSVGIGAFVADENARRTRVRWGFNFGGNYQIPVIDVNASVGTGFSQWLSRGGGFNEPQEFRWSDTSISFFRPIYTIPVLEVMMMGTLNFTIPTSRASLNSGLITTINPSLVLIRSFGPVTFIYALDYSHNFHTHTSVTYDPSEVDILSRSNGAESIAGDAVAAGGILNEIALYNVFGTNFRFSDFVFALRFGFGDFWTYDNGTISESDQFTSDYADVGRGHSQITFGTVRLSYMPIRNFTTTLSLSSQQPWKTADNKSFRFPFFDFESTANNFTTVALSFSGLY